MHQPNETTEGVGSLSGNLRSMRVASEEPAYQDLTKLFDTACAELPSGEFIKMEEVTLWDTLSAVVIMEPKLDTGMVLPEETEQSLLPPFNVKDTLSPLQALSIIMRIWSCEMTWNEGHSLAQTLYTCRYVHVVETREVTFENPIRDAVIAYVKGALACGQLIWTEMAKGTVYEEEDFVGNLYGLNIIERANVDDAIVQMQRAVDALHHVREHTQDPSEEAILQAMTASLALRLKWIELLRCYKTFASPTGEIVQAVAGSLKEALDFLVEILKEIPEMVNVDYAFDVFIYKRLPAHAPPRPIVLLDQEKSTALLRSIATGFEIISPLLDVDHPRQIMSFASRFAHITPVLPALCRATFLSKLFMNGKVMGSKDPEKDFLLPLLEEHAGGPISVTPPDLLSAVKDTRPKHPFQSPLPPPKNVQAIQDMAYLLVDTLRACGQNHARVRRLQFNMSLEWEEMQHKMEEMDQENAAAHPNSDSLSHLEQFPISTWVYQRKLTLLWESVLMGFELELYAPIEHAQIYWLAHYLLSVHCEMAQTILQHHVLRLNTEYPSWLEAEALSLIAMRDISHGLLLATLALQADGALPTYASLKQSLQDEGTRFSSRFPHCYRLQSPLVPTWDQFVSFREEANRQEKGVILESAIETLSSAKSTLDIALRASKKDPLHGSCSLPFEKRLQDMQRACIFNKINLQKWREEGGKGKFSLTFPYHPWFGVFVPEA